MPAEDLLRRHRLQSVALDDPYNLVSLKHYVAFFEDAAKVLRQPLLGIRLGAAIKPEDLGPIGVLFTMMQTLREAIERFSQFFPALQSSTRLGLKVEGQVTWFEYEIENATIWPRRQDAEFTLALLCALARSRLGRAWSPEEVHFEHSPLSGRRDTTRFFGAVVRFEQPINRMLIRAEDLDLPFASANPAAIGIIEQHVLDLIGDVLPRTFEESVANAITRCMKQGSVTLELVAARVGVGPRTLQRIMARQGKTFRQAVNAQRLNVAEIMLRNERISLGAVAGSLGYADVASMSRAFKAWTGESPRAFSRK
ncbi:AraC family transcriptional regulator [Bradyrhizobium sp. 183]|uniref:AraC family transcriptional regulator n=1 Tax=unclassified Bradyrhizobium TaxID=2631580 RepID=UPI001FFE8366|nr:MULTISPECIES: AraC family transcriptional regulator [unclassified Bradyrhizobium]UPJ79779.1 AraC family transcriptional regulator [Bradyrhizobium sp. 184]UPJ87574.1 AraC family transcriptional regulator [Bradyrhizobium sp. 183]